MAVDYAKGLSEYDNKGICGLPEIKDEDLIIQAKVEQLADWIKSSKNIVVLVGAGLSTSCGVPDFRGPQGVWTREMKNETVTLKSDDLNFKKVLPSFAHRALAKLVEKDLVKLIISQNVDGLFLKCGLTRTHLSEMHGNFFLDECSSCLKRFIRQEPSLTMGLKLSDQKCFKGGSRGKCRGLLRDTILDWEQSLPDYELDRARQFCSKADLVICMGTSLQIQPVNQLPFNCKRRKVDKGKVAIINLQKTIMDKKADLVISDYCDDLMKRLVELLDIKVDDYKEEKDLILNSERGTLWN